MNKVESQIKSQNMLAEGNQSNETKKECKQTFDKHSMIFIISYFITK
jgi:hypothetical protein